MLPGSAYQGWFFLRLGSGPQWIGEKVVTIRKTKVLSSSNTAIRSGAIKGISREERGKTRG